MFRMITGRSRHKCSDQGNNAQISFTSFSCTTSFSGTTISLKNLNKLSWNTLSLILRSYVGNNYLTLTTLLWLHYWSQSCMFSERFLLCSISLVYRHWTTMQFFSWWVVSDGERKRGISPFGLPNFQFFSLARIKKIAYATNKINML